MAMNRCHRSQKDQGAPALIDYLYIIQGEDWRKTKQIRDKQCFGKYRGLWAVDGSAGSKGRTVGPVQLGLMIYIIHRQNRQILFKT